LEATDGFREAGSEAGVMGTVALGVFLTFGFETLEVFILGDDCGRALAPLRVLALSFRFFPGAAIVPFSAPSEPSLSSALASALSLGPAKWLLVVPNILLWFPEESSFCRRAAGSSSSLELPASLVAPTEEAASALPLNVSSTAEPERRA
jgi:hypothetical protein